MDHIKSTDREECENFRQFAESSNFLKYTPLKRKIYNSGTIITSPCVLEFQNPEDVSKHNS